MGIISFFTVMFYFLPVLTIGPAIIQWSYRYSCWKLFALEIDAFLESVGSGTGTIYIFTLSFKFLKFCKC